jgi:uncharacterized membrane protein
MRNWAHRILNLSLYLVFCFMVGTGILLEYRLVPGSEGGHGLSALGMGRHDWGDWHFWLGASFVVLVILHLWLNRAWLHKIAAKMKWWRLWLGLIAGLIIILGIAFLPLKKSENGHGHGRGGKGHSMLMPAYQTTSISRST